MSVTTRQRRQDVVAWPHGISRTVRLLWHAARRGVAAELEWMRAELGLRAELAIVYVQGGLRVAGSLNRPDAADTTPSGLTAGWAGGLE